MKFSKDKRNSESSQSGFKFNNTNNDKSIHSRTKKESVVSISENKNLGTKDILKNNLVILEEDSKRELKKTPSSKELKKVKSTKKKKKTEVYLIMN